MFSIYVFFANSTLKSSVNDLVENLFKTTVDYCCANIIIFNEEIKP